MRSTIAFVAIPALMACVSQAKYDDMSQQLDAAKRTNENKRRRIASLEATVVAERAELRRRQAEMDHAVHELSSLGQAQGESRAEVTQLKETQDRLNQELASLAKERSLLKDSKDELARAYLELSMRKTAAELRVAEFKSMLVKFKDLIDAGTLRVNIVDGRMVLQLPTDVLFDSGSARLSKVGKAAIDQIAGVLGEMPERRVQVEGHTDNVPIHTATYPSNWELAAARALGVIRAMHGAGLDPARLSAASYGQFRPFADNELETGRALNRRIQIVLLPDLSSLPGLEELQQVVEAS